MKIIRRTSEQLYEQLVIESGGVAASPWKHEIDAIVSFIKRKKIKNPGLKKLVVPNEMTTKFHFINHLVITVYFENVERITQTIYGN